MLLKCNFGPQSEATYAESVGLSKFILHTISFQFCSLFAIVLQFQKLILLGQITSVTPTVIKIQVSKSQTFSSPLPPVLGFHLWQKDVKRNGKKYVKFPSVDRIGTPYCPEFTCKTKPQSNSQAVADLLVGLNRSQTGGFQQPC